MRITLLLLLIESRYITEEAARENLDVGTAVRITDGTRPLLAPARDAVT